MHEFLVELTDEDLELLGTKNSAEVEAAAAMLAEVAIGEIAYLAVLGAPLPPAGEAE